MDAEILPKKPVINCHTHVFTGKHVPPFLAKTILFWPLHYLLNTPLIMGWFCFWYKNEKFSPYFYPYKRWYKFFQKILYDYRAWVKRHLPVYLLVSLFNLVIIIHALLFILFFLFNRLGGANGQVKKIVEEVAAWLTKYNLLFFYDNAWIKIVVVLFVLVCIGNGRKLIFLVLKKTWAVLGLLPDSKTTAFLKRYLNIGRFANYKHSIDIFYRLKAQYDNGSGFVLLPMDMAYMGAGKLPKTGLFRSQMDQLAHIKDNYPDQAFPFLFADPRRIKEDPEFFKYTPDSITGTVHLGECMVKEYMETKKFNGFKIYPALGYYPFDPLLLPLWKYAADNRLPIITHAIRGTIYYRGTKEKSWGRHPVFMQAKGRKTSEYEPLLLPELKHVDYVNNFTHPLNYLCLVEEELLRKVVATADEKVKDLFGYANDNTPLKHDLKHLKLCFGHYGGEDEWQKFFESDRERGENNFFNDGSLGIRFLYNKKGDPIPGKLEQVWKSSDWYSIASSLMMQYDNLYADISYIVHDASIVPLLKKTLQHPILKKKVLFGTDFYVVRNHKSEKQMFAELVTALSEEEFDQLSRDNPHIFLKSVNFPG